MITRTFTAQLKTGRDTYTTIAVALTQADVDAWLARKPRGIRFALDGR